MKQQIKSNKRIGYEKKLLKRFIDRKFKENDLDPQEFDIQEADLTGLSYQEAKQEIANKLKLFIKDIKKEKKRQHLEHEAYLKEQQRKQYQEKLNNEFEEKLKGIGKTKTSENLERHFKKIKEITEIIANKEAKIHLAIIKGASLPFDTIIWMANGKKKRIVDLEDNEEILSYNFEKNKIEIKKAKKFYSGYKDVIEINTEIGVIRCSPEHRWFIERKGKIIEIEAKKIKETDFLLSPKDLNRFPNLV